jgi:general secretion pathway protein G
VKTAHANVAAGSSSEIRCSLEEKQPMTVVNKLRKQAKRGFTLVEILIVVIILGILAAIVIPQFTNASEDARKSNMQSQLQTLRSQIELFKLQHRDEAPLLITTGWTVLTSKTLDTGAVDAAGTFGPYMQQAAVNPMTGSSTLAAAADVDATTGWIYDEATGEIHGVSKAGVLSDTGD